MRVILTLLKMYGIDTEAKSADDMFEPVEQKYKDIRAVVMAEEVSAVGWVSEGSYEDFFDGSEGIDNTEISTKQRCVTDRAIQNQRALMITRESVEKQEMLKED